MIIETAIERGYHTFGVAEHAPRMGAQYLYPEETARGWSVAKLVSDFERYAETVHALAEEFADRITILCGFEAEVVPADAYADIMLDFKKRLGFDYMVGSVHWIDDVIIDYGKDAFAEAVVLFGGLEPLAVRYYETLAKMVRALKPDVVGHIDVIRKHADAHGGLYTSAIRHAATTALQAIREENCILDINSAALRRGMSTPYPAPWLLDIATRTFDIPVCFGDDSHGVDDVAVGIPEARQYLIDHGITTLTALAREDGQIVRKKLALQ